MRPTCMTCSFSVDVATLVGDRGRSSWCSAPRKSCRLRLHSQLPSNRPGCHYRAAQQFSHLLLSQSSASLLGSNSGESPPRGGQEQALGPTWLWPMTLVLPSSRHVWQNRIIGQYIPARPASPDCWPSSAVFTVRMFCKALVDRHKHYYRLFQRSNSTSVVAWRAMETTTRPQDSGHKSRTTNHRPPRVTGYGLQATDPRLFSEIERTIADASEGSRPMDRCRSSRQLRQPVEVRQRSSRLPGRATTPRSLEEPPLRPLWCAACGYSWPAAGSVANCRRPPSSLQMPSTSRASAPLSDQSLPKPETPDTAYTVFVLQTRGPELSDQQMRRQSLR